LFHFETFSKLTIQDGRFAFLGARKLPFEPSIYGLGPHRIGKLNNSFAVCPPFRTAAVNDGNYRDDGDAFEPQINAGCGYFAHLNYRREHNTLSRRLDA